MAEFCNRPDENYTVEKHPKLEIPVTRMTPVIKPHFQGIVKTIRPYYKTRLRSRTLFIFPVKADAGTMVYKNNSTSFQSS